MSVKWPVTRKEPEKRIGGKKNEQGARSEDTRL